MKQAMAREVIALRRYAFVLTRAHDQAEDLVQETLVRGLNALETFRPGGNLRVWLFRIMHNLAIDEHRRAGRERVAYEQVGRLSVASPDSVDLSAALQATIAALDKIPKPQADAVALVALRELSYDEAAQVLQVPVGTLMSRLARGREALRRQLDAPSPVSLIGRKVDGGGRS